jgi:hypothetical protein
MNDLNKKTSFELYFSDELLRLLDHLIGNHDWRKTQVTKHMLNELAGYRERIMLIRKASEKLDKSTSRSANAMGMPVIDLEKEMVVFVTLYQSKGKELTVWNHLLGSLSVSSVNRPVYSDERSARRAIADRDNLIGEGYAAVKIGKDKVMRDNISNRVDRLGQTIINLQAGALQSDNVLFFIHANKSRYYYDTKQKKLKLGAKAQR